MKEAMLISVAVLTSAAILNAQSPGTVQIRFKEAQARLQAAESDVSILVIWATYSPPDREFLKVVKAIDEDIGGKMPIFSFAIEDASLRRSVAPFSAKSKNKDNSFVVTDDDFAEFGEAWKVNTTPHLLVWKKPGNIVMRLNPNRGTSAAEIRQKLSSLATDRKAP